MFSALLARLVALRYVIRRSRIDRDMQQEFETHLEQLVERYVALGVPRDQARAAARRQFGNALRVREEIYQMNSLGWLENALTSARQALRDMKRRPVYTTALMTTAAVGIAASTTVFSLVDTVLLRPLPFPHASELVAVWQTDRAGMRTGMSPANAVDWEREAKSFSAVGLWTADLFTVSTQGDGERVTGALVTGRFFAALGVPAAIGRTFIPADETASSQVVLSHDVWRRVFAADRELVGRDVSLNGRPFTVVGIMPDTFVFPRMVRGETVIQPELYVPLETTSPMMRDRGAPFMMAIARLAPGVSVSMAQAETASIAKRLEVAFPRVNAGRGAVVVPLHEQAVGNVRTPLLLVLSASAILLVISCFNVAGMLIARAADRTAEVATRIALGATRGRLLSQFIVESSVVFVASAVVALGLVYGLQRALLVTYAGLLPRLSDISLDARVVAFAVGISLLTAVVFTAIPVAHTVSPDIGTLLGQVRRGVIGGRRVQRLRQGLIVAQVAIAMVLLVGTALMVRTLIRLSEVDLGFAPERATTFEVSIPATKYQRAESPAILSSLIERIEALPGVEAAGAINVLPLAAMSFTWTFRIENRPTPEGTPSPRVDYRVVTPGVFEAMGVSLRSGRLISRSDGPESPAVAVINEAMVRRFWPDENPVGQRIKIDGPPTPAFQWATIVGIVADVRGASVDAPPAPTIYRPVSQHPFMDMAVVVRTGPDAVPLPGTIRADARNVGAGLTLHNFRPLDTFVSQSTAFRRAIFVIVGVFAGAALFLVGIGIYGLVSTVVTQRFREMGIRMALGASYLEIVWTVMKDGLLLIAAGLAIGVAVALTTMPILSALLFDVRPTDASAYAGAAVLLSIIGLGATYLPARIVARLDPARALSSI